MQCSARPPDLVESDNQGEIRNASTKRIGLSHCARAAPSVLKRRRRRRRRRRGSKYERTHFRSRPRQSKLPRQIVGGWTERRGEASEANAARASSARANSFLSRLAASPSLSRALQVLLYGAHQITRTRTTDILLNRYYIHYVHLALCGNNTWPNRPSTLQHKKEWLPARTNAM